MVKATLDRHPDITCLGNIFGKKGWPDWRRAAEKWPANVSFRRLASLPEKWDRIEERCACPAELHRLLLDIFADRTRFGFKHHLGRIDRTITAHVIALEMQTVLLTRENTLAAYSSERIAKTTGQGVLMVGQQKQRAKVRFDDIEFNKFRQWRETAYAHWEDEVTKSGVRFLKIDYCRARTGDGMEEIAAFLSIDPEKLRSVPTQKRNSDSMLDRFSNPEDAKDYLVKNGLEDWLVED